MRTELQRNLPPSFLERGIEGVMPVLQNAREKPLVEMLMGFVDRLRQGHEVNIHESCCGMGVAAEQMQLLLNAFCIAADVRARASVIGSDINPLHEERLYPLLKDYHEIAFAYLRSWNVPGVDIETLQKEHELQEPQAHFIRASADQPIEHPGPLDFAFCINSIWYVHDKLAAIFNTVESLREDVGLALWDGLDLNSIKIDHIKGGKWQGNYKVRDFLRRHGHGLHDFQFNLAPDSKLYTLSAGKKHTPMGPRPLFKQAVDANAPASEWELIWNFAAFRRAAEYEFSED